MCAADATWCTQWIDDNFTGMMAAVVSLEPILRRLGATDTCEVSVRHYMCATDATLFEFPGGRARALLLVVLFRGRQAGFD